MPNEISTPMDRSSSAVIGERALARTSLDRGSAMDDPLTARSFRVWSAGDYDSISAGFRHEAAAFVGRLGLGPDDRVLDAACGTGNLSIPAARAGARVTGLDLVPTLLIAAARWALREALVVGFDDGNVEALPYGDGQFDVVMSMFGVMFAARPELVVAELARVTRPGGRVALANWTPEGFVGEMFRTPARHAPPAPGSVSPLLWGDDRVVRERFDEREWTVTTRKRMLTFRYPTMPTGVAELFCKAYGPTVRTLEALEPTARGQLTDELTTLWRERARVVTGAPVITEVDSEYLEVVAVRR